MVEYSTESLIEGVQEMEQSLISILQCASLPLKKNKASDELKYASLLPEFLKTLKYHLNVRAFFRTRNFSNQLHS